MALLGAKDTKVVCMGQRLENNQNRIILGSVHTGHPEAYRDLSRGNLNILPDSRSTQGVSDAPEGTHLATTAGRCLMMVCGEGVFKKNLQKYFIKKSNLKIY